MNSKGRWVGGKWEMRVRRKRVGGGGGGGEEGVQYGR